MIEDPMLGPAVPDLGWVPAPRYLLRRQRILARLSRLPTPQRVLEVGPGAGMLLQELAVRHVECHALETSAPARALIESVNQASGRHVQTHEHASSDWQQYFPMMFAFEVLEHIKDDQEALRQWSRWLQPGGCLLMSVPAHPSLWNAADVWAGHYRRYRKSELLQRITAAGLSIEHVECIGFPLGNLTETLQARSVARAFKQAGNEGERQQNNDRSGIERDGLLKWYPRLKSPVGRTALRCAFALQAATRSLPLGNGYLVQARKPG